MLGRLRHWAAQLRVIGETVQRLEARAASLDEEVRHATEALQKVQERLAHLEALAERTVSEVDHHRLQGTIAIGMVDTARQAIGRVESRQLRQGGARPWRENEFSVYSQYGEDGLIQHLFQEIPEAPHIFVEFGVEDYRQANTRFLLQNDRSWSGLVMDGSEENIAKIHQDGLCGWYDLKAASAWITRENIDSLFAEQGIVGEIGLLSIDIDGNDYWVWEAITSVDPVVVIVEYNYRFGPDLSVVVPYDSSFYKGTAHPSGIYYGASLAALTALANRKGYAFVGCSGGGVNAFFVRRDRLPATVREVSVAEGYVAGVHAEMIDPATGTRIKASLEEQQRLLEMLPLVTI